MTNKIKSQQTRTHSLQTRIIQTILLFGVVLSAAFATLQTRTALFQTSSFNAFKARISCHLVQSQLESAIADIESLDEQSQKVQEILPVLAQGGGFDAAWIIDQRQNVVARSDSPNLTIQFTDSEKFMINKIWNLERIERRFYSYLDKEHNRLELYTPILKDRTLHFLLKLSFSTGNLLSVFRQIYVPLITTLLIVFVLTALLAWILSRSIIKPLLLLDRATREIKEGKLNLRVRIDTGDEIEALGHTFNDMAESLQLMKAKAESANPLTKLPGNLSIQEDIENRIHAGKRFVVIHCDLDHFKAYNDKYGLGEGDRAIKLSAELLREAIQEKGAPDDFLGHEGGDDFVIITTPERAEPIAEYFMERFGKESKMLYSAEDRNAGFILSKNRQGEPCQFPLMSMSLAGISNQFRSISSYAAVTNLIIEVKTKAKAQAGNSFFLDRRKD